MFEFNELPNDIKNLIFQNNRAWTSNEIQKNKRIFLEVIDHIAEVSETTSQIFYDEDEEDNIIDNDWGFGNAMLECINDENLANDIDDYYQEQLEGFY